MSESLGRDSAQVANHAPPSDLDLAPTTDQAAEEALRANAADLLGYLARRIGRQDAADVLGTVLVTAWRRRTDLSDEPEAARMWLFVVARRTLANHRRGQARADALTERLRATVTAADDEVANVAGPVAVPERTVPAAAVL